VIAYSPISLLQPRKAIMWKSNNVTRNAETIKW
jgi:hypothetical protein